MKILVFGCNGQLGHSLTDTAPENVEVIGLDLPELDIADATGVLEICQEMRPDVIANAAAYTAVDKAEADVEEAVAANVDGARNIALAARDIGARVIHISTDFVFDGTSLIPYKTDAPTNPLSVYGRTKRDGELAVLEVMSGAAVVIRTSWLYSKTGGNFVKTMLRLMSERDELGIVADQFGTPTWATSLAQVVWGFVAAPEHSGIFHWSDGGATTWLEFAIAIQDEALLLGLLEREIPIHAIKTADYPTAAKRPAYSVLDCSTTHRATNMQPEEWRINLHKMLKGMAE